MARPAKRRRIARRAHVDRPLDEAWSVLLKRSLALSPGISSTLKQLQDFGVPCSFLLSVAAVALFTCDCTNFSSVDVLETFAGEHRVTRAFLENGLLRATLN